MGKGSTAKRNTPRTKDGRQKAREDTQSRKEPDVAPIAFPPPLRPRPRLLMVLSVVLALWVAFLLVLYFRTVYPHRNDGVRPVSRPVSAENDTDFPY
jgi:hypothetical protein